MWLDTECMEKIGHAAVLEGVTPADIIKKLPIMRGWRGVPEGFREWMTVGTGQILEKVDQVLEGGSARVGLELRESWVRELSEEVVDFVEREEVIRYLCPRCNAHI